MKKIILILIALVIGIVAVRVILPTDQISCEGDANQMKITYTLSEGRENVRVCWKRTAPDAEWNEDNSKKIGDGPQESTMTPSGYFDPGNYEVTLSEGSCALPNQNHFGSTDSCEVTGSPSVNHLNSNDVVKGENDLNTAEVNQSFDENGSFDPF